MCRCCASEWTTLPANADIAKTSLRMSRSELLERRCGVVGAVVAHECAHRQNIGTTCTVNSLRCLSRFVSADRNAMFRHQLVTRGVRALLRVCRMRNCTLGHDTHRELQVRAGGDSQLTELKLCHVPSTRDRQAVTRTKGSPIVHRVVFPTDAASSAAVVASSVVLIVSVATAAVDPAACKGRFKTLHPAICPCRDHYVQLVGLRKIREILCELSPCLFFPFQIRGRVARERLRAVDLWCKLLLAGVSRACPLHEQ